MIGFPGIGLEFHRNPVIFRFNDNFALTWYGLIIATGFLLAVLYALRRSESFGLKQEEVLDMLFFATPAGIIGARLYYVAFSWQEFAGDPLSIFQTWKGGMAIYGSVIGAAIAASLFCWVRHISIGAMLDIGAIGLLIGQAAGRWGNFVNGEVYGRETTMPWRMLVDGKEVHPLFLYESLWNVLGLVLLVLFIRRRKYNGQLFTMYIAWYGLGRGLLEGMREPEYNLMIGGKIMVSQMLGFVSCVAALLLLFYMTMFRKHKDILAWTADRDEYEKYRKAKKTPQKAEAPDAPEAPPEDAQTACCEEPAPEEDSADAEEEEVDGNGGDTQWDYTFKSDQE